MPLVINSLRGRHTHTDRQTHTHTLCGQDQFLETRREPATGWHTPGLKRKYVIKSREMSSSLKPVRNTYVAIVHQHVTVSSNTYSQMHVQIQHSLAYLQDLIFTLVGINYSYKH